MMLGRREPDSGSHSAVQSVWHSFCISSVKMRTLLVIALLGHCLMALGQEKRTAEEYELKAAFLLSVAKLVEWPPPARPLPGAPFRIGIVGKDPSGGAFQTSLNGKTLLDASVVVETIERTDQALACQLLFVPAGEKDLEAVILKAVKGHPVLTFGEHEGFLLSGGLFNFYSEDKKLRLELDNESARSAGMVISSKLLRVARIVKVKQ